MKKQSFKSAVKQVYSPDNADKISSDLMAKTLHLSGKTSVANDIVIAVAKVDLLPPAKSWEERPEKEKNICQQRNNLTRPFTGRAAKEMNRLAVANKMKPFF